jgi:signal transduction histidine kinase
MWPTGYIPRMGAVGGSGSTPIGPAMTTLRSVIAYLALLIRCAGIVYIVVQVVIWHSFYTSSSWRLVAPVLAVAWSTAVALYLRRHWPSPLFACADSAFYVALAIGAQACVPPHARDTAFSWLVISMSGQLIVPAWYAPGGLSVPLALSSPLAYWAGAVLQPVTNARTLIGSGLLLLAIGFVHVGGRRLLYGRAAGADAELDRADRAAQEQYAVLCRSIERREHERLLHDTVLNTLTALARSGGNAPATVVTRCRQDVTLIEAALSAEDLEVDSARPSDELCSEVRAVVADMGARGLTVHFGADEAGGADGAGGAAIPARVITAISNAVREALSNVAAHSGTREAWVSVRRTGAEGDADALEVVVRDRGAGFDLARVDKARLGLRRSITERVAECGGQASIWSAPGQGTEVSLCWPAPQPPDVPHLGDRLLAGESLPW